MMARCRASRLPRAALLLAAALSIGLALGLHPEPPFDDSRLSLSNGQTASSERSAASNDDCLACRAQNSGSLIGLGPPGLAPPALATTVVFSLRQREGGLPRPTYEGRAPPVLA